MIRISNKEHWLIEQENNSKNITAIRSDNKQYTYSDILSIVKKTSNYFVEKGIKSGEHVSIISENNLDFIIAINALWLVGAIPVLINARLNNDEINKLISTSATNHIIKIRNGFENNKHNVIEFDVLKFDEYTTEYNPVKYNPQNIALMLFTSGSTGDAKCVQLTFNNLYASAKSADTFIHHKQSDAWLASLPFYHIGGFSIITRTIISGCSLALLENFRTENILLNLSSIKPSLISLVPTMLNQLLEKNIIPWENLRYVFIGGGPATGKLINNAIKNGWPISAVYGSTETSSMVTCSSATNLKSNGISAGKPFSGIKIELDKKHTKDNYGRIVITSKSIGSYYSNGNTADSNISGEKYYSSDIGELDNKGNLTILGRVDNVIISGGENISLSEIQHMLMQNCHIQDLVLLGIKDEKWGQSYIIVSETKKDIVEKCLSEQLSKFKHPKAIYHLEKIPRNELGKVQKQKIKEIIKADFL